MALHLRRRDPLGEIGEGLRRLVAGLRLQRAPADRPAVEARRRAGLQPAEAKAEAHERFAQAEGRTLADPAGGDLGLADVDDAAQEGAGGDDDRARLDNATLAGHDAVDPAAPVEGQILDGGGQKRQIVLDGEQLLHRLAVELAVGLRPGTPDCRTFAGVEHPELDAGPVDDPGHEPVQGVDLADQLALGQAADGRVARHLADGGEVVGDEQRAGAEARRRRRSLAAGVAAADNDHVEAGHGADTSVAAGGCQNSLRRCFT